MDYVTPQHVARQLNISKKRVYQLITSGDLEALRHGPRMLRVTRASMETYVARKLAHEKRELGLDLPKVRPHRR